MVAVIMTARSDAWAGRAGDGPSAHLVAMGLETLMPETQCLSIMQTQDLDVGQPKPETFDDWQDLRQGGRV